MEINASGWQKIGERVRKPFGKRWHNIDWKWQAFVQPTVVLSYSLNSGQTETIFKLSVMKRIIGELIENDFNKYEQYLKGKSVETSFNWTEDPVPGKK